MDHINYGLLPDSHADRLLDLLTPREAYSVIGAASRLSISERFCRDLITSGELRAFDVGRRTLVSRKAIEDFVSLRDNGGYP